MTGAEIFVFIILVLIFIGIIVLFMRVLKKRNGFTTRRQSYKKIS